MLPLYLNNLFLFSYIWSNFAEEILKIISVEKICAFFVWMANSLILDRDTQFPMCFPCFIQLWQNWMKTWQTSHSGTSHTFELSMNLFLSLFLIVIFDNNFLSRHINVSLILIRRTFFLPRGVSWNPCSVRQCKLKHGIPQSYYLFTKCVILSR